MNGKNRLRLTWKKLEKWKCPKCESEDYKLEELVMSGRHGKGYFFYILICQKCGFSEMHFKHKAP
jgi:predicted nucleic-acid-binding Zn-ribbon protein